MKFIAIFPVLIVGVLTDPLVIDVAKSSNGDGGINYLSTDPTTQFCQLKDKSCNGPNINYPKFAPTAIDCLSRCAKNTKCLSAFYSTDKKCHLRARRCKVVELKNAPGGMDLYRLKTFESCTTDRPDFIGSTPKDVEVPSTPNKYCVRQFFQCFFRDIKFIPSVFTLKRCQDYCSANDQCKSVFLDIAGSCSLKRSVCSNNQLSASFGTDAVKVPAEANCAPYNPTHKYCTIKDRSCVIFNDIKIIMSAPTLESCQRYCSYDSRCRSIFYSTITNSCYLKNDTCKEGFIGLLMPASYYSYKC